MDFQTMDQAMEGSVQKLNPETALGSIGCRETFRDSLGPTSVELLRNSILHSIVNKETPTKVIDATEPCSCKGRRKISNLNQVDPDVKFLKRRCSSFNSPTKANTAELKSSEMQESNPDLEDEEIRNKQKSFADLSELIDSNSSEASGEFSDGREDDESGNGTIFENLMETRGLKNTSKSSLKLVFRNSSNSIFEDCSTYSITSPEVNVTGDKSGDPSTPDSVLSLGVTSYDKGNYAAGNSLLSETDDAKSTHSNNSTDDQNSLCDTFFSHALNGDYEPTNTTASQGGKVKDRKQSMLEGHLKKERSASGKDCDNISIRSVESSSGKKVIKRLRKRNRKNQTKESSVYDCPKCGVSYFISPNATSSTACCLHCDLWTSVEPIFMKREKLPWNTCRIC